MEAHNVKQTAALVAVSLTATTNGLVVDTQGYETLIFDINTGIFAYDGTNNLTVTVEESDAGDGTGMTAVAAGDYLDPRNQAQATWDRLLNATGEDAQAYKLGVKLNTKRYKRIVFTEAGAVTVVISATAILGRARHKPAGATQTP